MNMINDYWDLITKFWSGSTKWNTPFNKINILSVETILKLHFKDNGLYNVEDPNILIILVDEYSADQGHLINDFIPGSFFCFSRANFMKAL